MCKSCASPAQVMFKSCKSHVNFLIVLEIEQFSVLFMEWNKTTPQTHIRKFEELTAWGQMSWWGSFMTSIGFSGLMWTLWMSEMTPSKTPILMLLVLQMFLCRLEVSFSFSAEKTWPENINKKSIWNNYYSLPDVLYIHRASVWGVRIQDGYIVTGSMDGTIAVIDVETLNTKKHFKAHETEWGSKYH